jgi:8-oxo-dGTP pyrophosphatase MutT (NUDIX family)
MVDAVKHQPEADSFARPRIAAGAIFRNSAGAVLLVQPTYKPHWDIPGGYVEHGESPLAACQREIREELGLVPPVGRLLLVDWAPNANEGDKILFVFDGGLMHTHEAAKIELPPSELCQWAFVDPDDFAQHLVDRLSRRLRAAVTAADDPCRVYAEHGLSV